ncbi:uncharacterized protein LOC130015365 [Mercurialis annua]|uniref:uncharacterized protein LOC130015365 n=1 Tax=Mercurialis annua TaxID=3986 RepID=UPI0024ADF514|nr:uncharacterized protein LOC130015365 [Mercurialis annua]
MESGQTIEMEFGGITYEYDPDWLLLSPAEDCDSNSPKFGIPRCVDGLQNLNVFKAREERKCEEKEVCKVGHEKTVDYGPRVMDLYSIILKRNKKVPATGLSLKGRLKGVIQVWGEPDLRWDIDAELSGEDEDRSTLTLYDPNTTRLFSCDRYYRIAFALTLNDQSVLQGTLHEDDYFYEDARVFGDGKRVSRGHFNVKCDWTSLPYLNNRLLEIRVDPGSCDFAPRRNDSELQIFAWCAVMRPGLVAKIQIKVKNGRNITTVSGSIYARPCCFTHQIPLIDSRENTEVAKDGIIVLKRLLVAVPSHASLVIAAENLVDNHENSVALSANTFFVPEEKAPAKTRIMYEKTVSKPNMSHEYLEAEVEWIYQKY